MKSYAFTNKALKPLRKGLPWGAVKDIAEETGMSESYVSMVLRGERFNLVILEVAIRLRDEYKKRHETVEGEL
jgi:transcriptional regulator with XRE-family HTH domain